MSTFQVGEVAILVQPSWNTGWIEGCAGYVTGQEVTVTEPLSIRPMQCSPGTLTMVPAYMIATPDGCEWVATPDMLRKRPPPQKREDLGDWELCPWKPAKRATVSESDAR